MADINAQAGQVLGVAQPPVANNQPRDFSNIKLLANQLDQLNNKQEALVSGLGSLNQGLAAEQGAIAQGKQKQEEVEASGREAARRKQVADEQAAQQEYKRLKDEQPLPAFVPTKDSGMDLAKLMSSMAVMGTLMGRSGGGQSAINAMASMKGMMEGWQQGRQDLYKKESDEFTKNYNRMLKIHGEFRQEMEDAIKLASTNKEAAYEAAHTAAVKLGSDIVKHQVNEGNFKAAIESVKAMDKLVADMKKTVNKQLSDALKRESELQIARERTGAMIAAAGLRQPKGTLLYNPDTNEYINIGPNQIPPAGNWTKPPSAPKPGKPQADDNVSFVANNSGAVLPEKKADLVSSLAGAFVNSASIKQIVKEHPEYVGRSGQVEGFINKTIDSINLGVQPDFTVDSSDQAQLVFAKRYAEYLVKYEQALAGGARGFTVFFQRRFNELLSQNQFNPSGINNLMDDHMRELTAKAVGVSPKINRQNFTEMAKDLAERNADEDAIRYLGPYEGPKFAGATQKPAKPSAASAAPAAAPKSDWTDADEKRLRELESKYGSK
jgi:hypothetical protein